MTTDPNDDEALDPSNSYGSETDQSPAVGEPEVSEEADAAAIDRTVLGVLLVLTMASIAASVVRFSVGSERMNSITFATTLPAASAGQGPDWRPPRRPRAP